MTARPYEPDRAGSATSYEAVDERTGEPVSVTLIPAESIDPAEREGFEEHVSSAQKLRHVNIAKVLDFGREGDDYVYVSERLAGETLASWVRSHGPMPADAALTSRRTNRECVILGGFSQAPVSPHSALRRHAGARADGRRHLAVGEGHQLRPAGSYRLRPEPQPIESDVPGKTAEPNRA